MLIGDAYESSKENDSGEIQKVQHQLVPKGMCRVVWAFLIKEFNFAGNYKHPINRSWVSHKLVSIAHGFLVLACHSYHSMREREREN